MRDKEKQKRRTVRGWRLLKAREISSCDEILRTVWATPDYFFVHKTSTKTFTSKEFPNMELHIPRTWLKRAKIYTRK
jgi:hypothetical protein